MCAGGIIIKFMYVKGLSLVWLETFSPPTVLGLIEDQIMYQLGCKYTTDIHCISIDPDANDSIGTEQVSMSF